MYCTRAVRSCLSLLLFTGTITGQRTWVVAARGGAGIDFTTIQAAVNAAASGDTIRVRVGSYAGFRIDAKGLSVIADAFVEIDSPEPQSGYGIGVFGTTAAQTSIVRGISVRFGFDGVPMYVHQCAGAVSIEACTFDHRPNGLVFVTLVSDSARVSLSSCTMNGQGTYPAGAAKGIMIYNSAVTMTGCTLRGGGFGPPGAPGAYVERTSSLRASACTFIGGQGREGEATSGGTFCLRNAASGGDGVLVEPGGIAYLDSCNFQPGAPGASPVPCPPGQPGLPVRGEAFRPGRWTGFGAGCAGSNGQPPIQALAQVGDGFVQGTPITWSAQRAPTNAVAVLAFGFNSVMYLGARLPLDLGSIGAPGCRLFHDLVLSLPSTTDALGSLQTVLTLPSDSATMLVPFYSTYWFVDSAVSRPLPIAVSNAVELRAGGRFVAP